jgi:hypothetical protein
MVAFTRFFTSVAKLSSPFRVFPQQNQFDVVIYKFLKGLEKDCILHYNFFFK